MLELLNGDLANEYRHLHFYLNAASVVQGLHRNHVREFLLKEAAGEMGHSTQFADLITGFGGKPSGKINGFRTDLTDPKSILQYALLMEDEVVANYVQRQKDAEQLGGVDGRVIDIFLDEQILDSRHDADNIRNMLSGL